MSTPESGEATRLRGQVTQLLRRLGGGDEAASPELLKLVYGELHALAGQIFARRGGGVTLQPTALAHDAYLRLAERGESWNDRQHFFAVASIAMRDMLRDSARARSASKRGGSWERVSLAGVDETPLAASVDGEVDLVQLDTALTKLSALSPRQGRIVELRFLTGLPVAEVARILDVSVTTVGNEWRAARAFLSLELGGVSR